MNSSSLLDAFRASPVESTNHQLDLNSLSDVPDSYAWTQLDDGGLHSDSESIPVVDLKDPNAAQLIGNACKTWGAFQVINHEVQSTHFDDIETLIKSLFSLPLEQKCKTARSADDIAGYGFARIAKFFNKLMWYEGFTVVGSPLDHFRLLWPKDYSKFCEVIEAYQKEMKRLARELIWLMLGSLGIAPSDIEWAGPNGDFNDKDNGALQLNNYPICPDPNKAMGLAAHTDSTFLTILHQNMVSGLQVKKKGGKWVTIPPVSGALVINVGDLLHIISNGLYPGAYHRAIVNGSNDRVSAAYLYMPPTTSVEFSPLKKLVGEGQLPLYRNVTWKEFVRAKTKLFEQALPSLQVNAQVNEAEIEKP